MVCREAKRIDAAVAELTRIQVVQLQKIALLIELVGVTVQEGEDGLKFR